MLFRDANKNSVAMFCVAIGMVCLLIYVGFAWYNNSVQQTAAAEEAKVQAAADEKKKKAEDAETVTKLLEATLRTFAADKVCYDESNNDYYVHVVKHVPNDEWLDEGWYLMDHFTFKLLSNGTYVLTSSGDMNAKVYPSIEGLACKEQRIDPSWFK